MKRVFNKISKRKPSKKLRLRVYQLDNFECVYCGQKEALTLDHLVPFSQGGATTIDNLVTSCLPCNRTRANQTTGWRKRYGRYRNIE